MRGGNRNCTHTCCELLATTYVQRDCSSTADRFEERGPLLTIECFTGSIPQATQDTTWGQRGQGKSPRLCGPRPVNSQMASSLRRAACSGCPRLHSPCRPTRCWCDNRSVGHPGPPVRHLTHGRCAFSSPLHLHQHLHQHLPRHANPAPPSAASLRVLQPPLDAACNHR